MADTGEISRKTAPRLRFSPSDPSPAEPIGRLEPVDLWPLTKQIDGLGGEWTFPVFMWRAINFHLMASPPLYYEPVSNFDRLSLEALLHQRATNVVPYAEQGSLLIVVKVFPSIFDARDGVVNLPEEGEPCIGQHTLSVLGIQDENTLVIRNSWSGWKDDHIGYLSRGYFDRYGQEGSIARMWNRGPTAATVETLLRGGDGVEFRKLWPSGRRWGTVTNVAGEKRLRFKWYECWSLQEEVPAEFLTLELDGRTRVAVAVLVHYPGVSELSELFVWPNYRRRGYGSLLEEAAADRGRQAASQELGIYVWNSDTVRQGDQAEGFLASRGYAIERYEKCQAVMYGKRKIH